MTNEKLDEKIDECMLKIAKHETLLDQYGKWMTEIAENIKELRETLICRPSWLVTIALSALCTISVSLIVYIVTNVGVN
jgi:peptidoglycan hydrolase CwlO-like protein